MKITITRSFSRTKQIAAFEPINAFCSASAEIDEAVDGIIPEGMMLEQSAALDSFCRSEVEKTIDAEIARRKSPDPQKIQDTAKAESEKDAGQEALDRQLDKEAQAQTPPRGYREI